MSAGCSRVEPFMHKFRLALSKIDLDDEIKTTLYNRAYEAVYAAIEEYDTSNTCQESVALNTSNTCQESVALNFNRHARRKLSKLNKKPKGQ